MNAEERAVIASSLRARFAAITEIHHQTPTPATKPTAPAAATPDERAVRAAFRAAALSNIGRFDRTRRTQAKEAADNHTNQWLRQAREHNQGLRAQHQASLDEQWQRRLTNDPAAVLPCLEQAFAGKTPRVSVASLAGAEVSLTIVAPPLSTVPDRKPAVTGAGNLSLKRLTKTETNAWYRLLLAGHIILTAKRAFAAAPGLTTAHIAALDPGTSGALMVVTLQRETLARSQLTRADNLLDSAADRVYLRTTGSAQTLVPFDLSALPDFRTKPRRTTPLTPVTAPTYLLEPPPVAFLPVLPTTPQPPAIVVSSQPVAATDAPPPLAGVSPGLMSPAAWSRTMGVVAAALALVVFIVGWVIGPGKTTYVPRAPVAYAALPDALPKALTVKDVRVGGDVILTDPIGTEHKVTLEHVLVPSSGYCLSQEAVAHLETLLLGATVDGYETGELTVDGTLVAAELVRAGLAVPDPAGTATDPEYRTVAAAQEEARAALVGLYSDAKSCTIPAQVAAYVALAAGLSTEADTVIAFAVLETESVDALNTNIDRANRKKQYVARLLSGSNTSYPLVPFTSEEIEAFRAQVTEADSVLEAAIARTDERIEAEEVRLEQEAAAAAAAAAAAQAERDAQAAAAAAAVEPEPAALEPWNMPGPDLDCSDIRKKVWISGIDYHRLDRDGDGWGCETYG